MTAKSKLPNNLRQIREEKLMSITEIARKVGLSPLTIKRMEEGESCRMDTKRKVLEALGIPLDDQKKIFPKRLKNLTKNRYRYLIKFINFWGSLFVYADTNQKF
jgi:transcriptional regulator with XRE-family HTH domain